MRKAKAKKQQKFRRANSKLLRRVDHALRALVQVLTSVVAGLACYVCSSAVASAVASASGGVAIPTSPSRRAPPIGPTLFLLYLFSVKKVKKRNRYRSVGISRLPFFCIVSCVRPLFVHAVALACRRRRWRYLQWRV